MSVILEFMAKPFFNYRRGGLPIIVVSRSTDKMVTAAKRGEGVHTNVFACAGKVVLQPSEGARMPVFPLPPAAVKWFSCYRRVEKEVSWWRRLWREAGPVTAGGGNNRRGSPSC